jgi:ferredoxin
MYAPDTDHCFFCKTGTIVRTDQEIAFKQQTKKGYVFCHVTIPVDICDDCGLKSCDRDAEAIIENAVWQEYKRLP